MKKIETTNAPGAIGPYSQGMVSGKLVFTSGQIPLDPETGAIVGDTIEAQSEQALKNLQPAAPASPPWSRPPASSPTWGTSPPSTGSTPASSPVTAPPAPAWR